MLAQGEDLLNIRTNLGKLRPTIGTAQERQLIVHLRRDDLPAQCEIERRPLEQDLLLLAEDMHMARRFKATEKRSRARQPCDGDAQAQKLHHRL